MPQQLFDMDARVLRRERAARGGPALFLYERAFDDILERLEDINRSFGSALLIGCPDPQWPERLRAKVRELTVVDPGPAFASASRGQTVQEDELELEPRSFDLCVAVGTLDSVNDLPGALLRLQLLLKPDSLLIGVMSGGETLPRLRSAMRAADSATGIASPRVHPRVEPSALTQLLTAAGFTMPVVDIDRVKVSYVSLNRLVSDLRSMGATNILSQRSKVPLSRAALAAAKDDFEAAGERTVETFELLHFAGWTPGETNG